MKVKLVREYNRLWYHNHHEVFIDGESAFEIGDLNECPEDAMIGRDLLDGDDILAAIKRGYEAGKRGEELEIEVVEEETP